MVKPGQGITFSPVWEDEAPLTPSSGPHVSPSSTTPNDGRSVDDFLRKLNKGEYHNLKWEDYLAPADLQEDLRSIADYVDPALQKSCGRRDTGEMVHDGTTRLPSGYVPIACAAPAISVILVGLRIQMAFSPSWHGAV